MGTLKYVHPLFHYKHFLKIWAQNGEGSICQVQSYLNRGKFYAVEK